MQLADARKPWWRWALYAANMVFVLFAGFFLLLAASVDWGSRSAGQVALLAGYTAGAFLLTTILSSAAILATTQHRYSRATAFTGLALLGAPISPILLNNGILAL